MTDRELFFKIMRGEVPPRFPSASAIQIAFTPGEHSDDPVAGEDWFGVRWERQPDGTQMFDSNRHRIASMEHWREVMPVLRGDELRAWGEKVSALFDRENRVQVVIVQSGHFERMQTLVGFEDALTAFYEYPEETMDFFNALTDYKIGIFRQIREFCAPDAVSPHDDWGMNRNMFFPPEVWRKFVKPQLKRLADAAHALGMLYEQHTCGYITQIFGDMVECGVDLAEIQAVNDLAYIKENYGDQIVLRGCMNGQVLGAPGTTPEQARAEVRRTLGIVARGGRYVAPGVWGAPPEVMEAVRDEYARFAEENYGGETAQ